MGEMRHAYNILVEEPEGKKTFGRPGRRWEDNIRMDLREMGWEGVDLYASGLGQGPVADCCEHGNETSGSIKGGGRIYRLAE
jgi:hypothetical protein